MNRGYLKKKISMWGCIYIYIYKLSEEKDKKNTANKE